MINKNDYLIELPNLKIDDTEGSWSDVVDLINRSGLA